MPSPPRHRLLQLAPAALILAGTGLIGFCLLFANFPAYDDEGYILHTAREVARSGGLYDVVYSQYGPAFYTLTTLLQSVLVPELDHTSARVLTLLLWVGTALAGGIIVARHARSVALFAFATAGAFLYLHFTPNEAFHPGTLIIFLVVGSILAMDVCLEQNRTWAAVGVGGGLAALLLLIKVNVGVFHLLTLGSWCLLHALPARQAGLTRGAVCALLLLAAAGLMRQHAGASWVLLFLAVFSVGAVTLALHLRATVHLRLRDLGGALLAAVVVSLVVLGFTLLRGTSVSGLLDGMLLEPLRHAASYSYAVDWRPGTALSAGVSLVAATAVLALRRAGRPFAADGLVVLLRAGMMMGLVAATIGVLHARVIGTVFSFVLPWLWVAAAPLESLSDRPNTGPVRSLLALTILLQSLQAYPIGGIQEAWGTFLVFPLVALALDEAARWLRENVSRRSAQIIVVTASSILLLVSFGKLTWGAVEVTTTYRRHKPLDLPGTAGLRLPAPMADAYRILSVNAVVHADMLFSLPGMFSFNLWTGLPTPTQRNTTVWFTLLDEGEQEDIITALERSPNPCIIVDQGLLQLMRAHEVEVTGRLKDHLLANYAAVFQIQSIAFLVRHGRAIAPIHLAVPGPATAPDERGFDTQLTFNTFSHPIPVERIIVQDESRTQPDRFLQAGNAAVTLTPIDRSGRPAGPSTEASWPLVLPPGLVSISLRFKAEGVGVQRSTLRLVSADGSELGVIGPHD